MIGRDGDLGRVGHESLQQDREHGHAELSHQRTGDHDENRFQDRAASADVAVAPVPTTPA
jgi:hypothetical protein